MSAYGFDKPHIFKVRGIWVATHQRPDGIDSSWLAPTFSLLRGWLS